MPKGNNFANLTPGQAIMLRSSWRVVQASNVQKHMKRVMELIERKNPKTKEIFTKSAAMMCFSGVAGNQNCEYDYAGNGELEDENDEDYEVDNEDASSTSPTPAMRTAHNYTVNDHARLLAQLIDDTVGQVHDAHACAVRLRQCGAAHAKLHQCNLRASFWEVFGEAAMEAFSTIDGLQANKEAVKAWRVALAQATHELRVGFEQECRKTSNAASRVCMQQYAVR